MEPLNTLNTRKLYSDEYEMKHNLEGQLMELGYSVAYYMFAASLFIVEELAIR